jgi:hypothetical protein
MIGSALAQGGFVAPAPFHAFALPGRAASARMHAVAKGNARMGASTIGAMARPRSVSSRMPIPVHSDGRASAFSGPVLG